MQDQRAYVRATDIVTALQFSGDTASCLAVVARLLDDFGGHPVGGPDEGVALGHSARQLRGHPKVRQLHQALHVESLSMLD